MSKAVCKKPRPSPFPTPTVLFDHTGVPVALEVGVAFSAVLANMVPFATVNVTALVLVEVLTDQRP